MAWEPAARDEDPLWDEAGRIIARVCWRHCVDVAKLKREPNTVGVTIAKQEILDRLIRLGLPNEDIADILFMGTQTVRRRRRMLRAEAEERRALRD
jgi:DNA-binding NarL/FixJ family response regulator